MSWVVSAYTSLPENKRPAFLRELNPNALSGATFDEEKNEYVRARRAYIQARKKMRSVEEIEAYFKPLLVYKICPIRDKLIKATTANVRRNGRVQPDGFCFDSMGELLKHRIKSRRYYFYFRYDPTCFGDAVINSETFKTVRDVLHKTYDVVLEPVHKTGYNYHLFTAYSGDQEYFSITIGPQGAILTTDWCTPEEIERFCKPFTLQ